jgi:hypothetical protein
MYIPGWPKNEDALYYLKRDNVVPDLPSQDAVREAVRRHGAIRVVTEEQHAAALQAQAGLVVERCRSFDNPVANIYSCFLCRNGPQLRCCERGERRLFHAKSRSVPF